MSHILCLQNLSAKIVKIAEKNLCHSMNFFGLSQARYFRKGLSLLSRNTHPLRPLRMLNSQKGCNLKSDVYSDLNKSLIPPIEPMRLVAS